MISRSLGREGLSNALKRRGEPMIRYLALALALLAAAPADGQTRPYWSPVTPPYWSLQWVN
jgi:hypothetical protein